LNPSWDDIKNLIEESRLTGDIQRTADRVRFTAEIFTPSELVCRLLSRLPIDSLGPGQTVLDPACGDGQFLFAVKLIKMTFFGMNEKSALEDLYGIDLLAENVNICRRRLGGGSIAIGNALHPEEIVEGQMPEDIRILENIFDTYQPALFR